EQALRDAGAETVDLATTLSEVEDCLAGTEYDAVVLDLRLPDGETFDLGTQLLDKHVPLVIHSGHADLDHSHRLPNAVFCAKPSTPQDLVHAVIEARKIAAVSPIFHSKRAPF
ncbi:MAG: hypothetical protein ABJH26_12230, partial [Marinomonas sp.]